MPTRTTPADVAALIRRRDPAFRSVITACGNPPSRRGVPVDQRFGSIARSITFQLLATRAAETIHARVIELCSGDVSVDAVLHVGAQQLKTAGLTRTKAQAMVDLAQDVRAGRVQLSRHGYMSDAEVLREITTVRGIGPWTAQMYLMSTLARADVWPVGDFGVRNGWTIAHGLNEMISEKGLRAAGERFVGVRSALAWYCWQTVHLHRATN